MVKKYRVWAGRYNKIVTAKSYAEAMKKSKYKNVDQIDLIKKR